MERRSRGLISGPNVHVNKVWYIYPKGSADYPERHQTFDLLNALQTYFRASQFKGNIFSRNYHRDKGVWRARIWSFFLQSPLQVKTT